MCQYYVVLERYGPRGILFTVQDRLFLRKGRQLETNKLLKLYFISVFEN